MKKLVGVLVCMILIGTVVLPVMGELPQTRSTIGVDEILLPPPLDVDMVLEESISRRMSVRSFTGGAVTDEELSTILWAAYGFTENGNRTIFNPDGTYSTVIYVIRSDATYTYNPENHSLVLFVSGNYLHLGSYTSPIKFGLVWDMDVESDELRGMVDIGMIGQNIYFDANALDLGVVTTALEADDLYQLGLPSNEKPEIVMPLGHPASSYDFTYNPLPPANLPEVVNNSLSLEDAVTDREIVDVWDDSPLSLLEQSQLLWSSYGYSYLYDNVNNKRHRTVPSAIAYYPFKIFMANQTGVYQYSYSTHSITETISGDHREAIKDTVDYGMVILDTAPVLIIPCLDTNIGGPQYQSLWFYENGAIINNVLLEATALGLCSNVIFGIDDEAGLRAALGIAGSTNLVPVSVVPVGNPTSSPNTAPGEPAIDGPLQGIAGTSYIYTFNSVDPDGDDVYYYVKWGDGQSKDWHGPHDSGENVTFPHTYLDEGSYTLEAKARDRHGLESDWALFEVTMPVSKGFPNVLFLWFLERFPRMFPVLRYIYGW